MDFSDIPRTQSFLKRGWYYLRLKWLMLRNNPDSIDFYKQLQDYKVNNTGLTYARGYGIGEGQLDFLKRKGLQRSDRLLEIGCGDLRGGRYIIRYLAPENYTGIDISSAAINRAREVVGQEDLAEKHPTLVVNDDLRFDEFDRQFDVIFAHSVFTHLAESHIQECFENINRVLSGDGVFYSSFTDADQRQVNYTRTVANSNQYKYPFSFFVEEGRENGFRVSVDDYPEYPFDGMKMLIIEPNVTGD
jgi:SAM-dependent methyltransferase